MLASLVYKGIIEQRHTSSSYIIGYGIVIPSLLYFPFMLSDLLDLQNSVLRFVSTLCPVLSLFRTMEAMYGFSPGGSENSVRSYMGYYSAIGEVIFNKETKETIPPKKSDIMKKLIMFAVGSFGLGFFSSILIQYDFYPFGFIESHNIGTVLSFGNIGNNLSSAILVQSYIATFLMPMSALLNLFQNFETVNAMTNALFTAESVSDFWGKKWNLLVHGVLKRGVFKPVRSISSSPIAAICTFIASGLFHEWIILVLIYDGKNIINLEKSGYQMKFFIWNAFLAVLETLLLKKINFWEKLRNIFPHTVVSVMVIMFAVPIAHWFLDPYIELGLLHHGQIAFPTFVLKSL